ncbi:hypothetical protein FA10DRAFT_123412 [Acaromyces ingoldii]|uniref:Uncharacterized protein n=1 Tax=Acaromyces ingoldii TaxID=215250 RepID=A0A316YNP7_9BASI|nr:hypothetical protein FA10DRAFT_123412 [Acaromyces ingoldii]PWN90782.1 hypothetical protein FA10DRAFT_123412 [Acaromyces ingoldii]
MVRRMKLDVVNPIGSYRPEYCLYSRPVQVVSMAAPSLSKAPLGPSEKAPQQVVETKMVKTLIKTTTTHRETISTVTRKPQPPPPPPPPPVQSLAPCCCSCLPRPCSCPVCSPPPRLCHWAEACHCCHCGPAAAAASAAASAPILTPAPAPPAPTSCHHHSHTHCM